MTVIFVCTGNTCRSPTAEAIARRLAAERGMDVTFASAGAGAAEGLPASDGAVLVAMERGLDLSGHRSRPLAPELGSGDALFLGMTPSHVAGVRAVVPGARAELLDAYASGAASTRSIADPFGGDLAGYRVAANQLEELLPAVLDRLAAELASGRR